MDKALTSPKSFFTASTMVALTTSFVKHGLPLNFTPKSLNKSNFHTWSKLHKFQRRSVYLHFHFKVIVFMTNSLKVTKLILIYCVHLFLITDHFLVFVWFSSHYGMKRNIIWENTTFLHNFQNRLDSSRMVT